MAGRFVSGWAAKPGAAAPSRRLSALPARVQRLLDAQDWMMPDPAVQVTPVRLPSGASFAVIRDDLTHPLLGGNKFRKLDGLWAGTVGQAADVVTCGGLQSAHTLAVAAACAERGRRCHLLVRGERPAVPTGNHLYARMLAHHVEYVSRKDYADRGGMFARYLAQLRRQHWQAGEQPQLASQQPDGSGQSVSGEPSSSSSLVVSRESSGSSGSGSPAGTSGGVAVIPEGAATSAALLGLVRLVAWLAQHSSLAGPGLADGGTLNGSSSSGRSSGSSSAGPGRVHLVVDCGTGATATGLALGAALLDLPWRVTGVVLAGPLEYYQQQQRDLTAAFCAEHWAATAAAAAAAAGSSQAAAAGAAAEQQEEEAAVQRGVAERLHWVPRWRPRKFGRVLPGEVAACRAVAQRHGILLDPIWSLAAWEAACQLAEGAAGSSTGVDCQPEGSARRKVGGTGGSSGNGSGGSSELVAMLHTGGMLGLAGLAQRFPEEF